MNIVWEYNSTDELRHYGILGMKWGVRRYQNKDGSLTAKGVKRYAEKGYAEDAYKSNKTKYGKAYDKVTGANKTAGKMKAKMSTNSENKKRANEYINSKTTKKTRDAIANLSTRKALAESVLMGNYGALVYNSLRANNVSRGKAMAQAVLNNWANNLTLGKASKNSRW